MANYYDPLQFGGFMPDPYAAPNKSAGGANPYTLALLQAVGGLMTPGPYYGAFGGQVGQAATAGAQGMGQVQRLELLRKQQEAEDAYRRGVLGVKQSELSEDQRQFDKSMDLAKGIFPEYFGGQQPAQQPATPNVMSQGFEPQTNMFGLEGGGPPTLVGPSARSYRAGPSLQQQNVEMRGGASGGGGSPAPPGFTDQQIAEIAAREAALRSQDTGQPRNISAGFETIQAPGQAPQSVIGAAKQRVTADNEAADLMRRGAALSFVNKDAGKAIQDYAKFLQTDANEQRKFEQGKTEIDPYGIRIDTVNDTESVLEPDGQGGFKLRQIGTEEANRIRNKGREAAASKISLGFNPTDAGKAQLAASGITDMKNYRALLYGKDGKVDRSLVAQMNVPFFKGVPWTDSRRAVSYLFNAVEGKLRIESGAAVPKDEVVRIMDRFFPSIWDDNETIADKERRLTAFLEGTFERIKGENVLKDEYGNVYNFNTEDRFDNKGNPVKTEFPEEFTPSGLKNKSSRNFSGQNELDEINKELEEIDRQLKGIGK